MSLWSVLVPTIAGVTNWYRADELSGTVAADSKGTTAGTYSGTYTLNQTSLIAGDTDPAFSVTEASAGRIALPNSIAPTGVNPYSWVIAIKPTTTATVNQRIIGQDHWNGTTELQPNLLWRPDTKQISHQRVSSGGPTAFATLDSVIDGTKTYLVGVTYDGNATRIYVNGAMGGTIADTGSIAANTTVLNIGASGDGGNGFNGVLDEAIFANVALSGETMRDLYLAYLNQTVAANNAHWYGAYVQGAGTANYWSPNPTLIDTWINWATNNGVNSRKPGLMHDFKNWTDAHFDNTGASEAAARGLDYMVTWQPWDPAAAGTGGKPADQPIYALQNIIAGNFDTYITTWANDIKAYAGPVLLRWAQEFNGDYFVWGTVQSALNNNQSDYVAVNTPARYVSAWQHIRGIFNTVGVTNVKWVWCANCFFDKGSNANTLAASYPGDAYVDYVAMDSFNWGRTTGGSSIGVWDYPLDMFATTYDAIYGPPGGSGITTKPMILAEVACTEGDPGGSKATWLTDFIGTVIPKYLPNVVAFVWVDYNNPTARNWSINSASATLTAFQNAVNTSQYALGTPLLLPNVATITALSPNPANGGVAGTLTVTGTNFDAGALIRLDGVNQDNTIYGSATSLSFAYAASIGVGGHNISVVNPNAAASPVTVWTVTAGTPVLLSLSPNPWIVGTPGPLIITSNGGFVSGSVVNLDSVPQTTTVLSSTRVSIACPANETPGSHTITVTNP